MKAKQYQDSSKLVASCLRGIHLRGDCTPMKRTVVDAKYLCKVLNMTSELQVYLGHGQRLRKISFHRSESARQSTITADEKIQWCLEL